MFLAKFRLFLHRFFKVVEVVFYLPLALAIRIWAKEPLIHGVGQRRLAVRASKEGIGNGRFPFARMGHIDKDTGAKLPPIARPLRQRIQAHKQPCRHQLFNGAKTVMRNG